MWSYDRAKSALRTILGALVLSWLAACTVQPLYGTAGGPTANRLPIEVADIGTRAGFMLRDELVFLINGGRSQPNAAPFRLEVDLRKKVRTSNTAKIADGDISRTFAGQVELRGTYTLLNIETGETIATGQRRAFAQYDRSTQLYALRSAEEDAEEDAARELARIIVLALNAKLKNYAPPQVVAK
ncbi:LPS assembly lipoprotein LptE [Notoacmeibacter marinus]|uniref:LPS assembly lipoprotein LptE n=1 Tax=Notoacmeibacter marinus TaxID=1876515 RepID=UPI000DF12E67|nr:LPS assembly lipoprotein LptE [Notoacmeibacter marinus]